MAARVYTNGCLTPDQIAALDSIGIDSDVIVDTDCKAESLNTCGKDALEILSLYPVYDTTKGVYTKWGDINSTWNTDSPNDVWQTASFTDTAGYRIGDKVILIVDDGYRLEVYEAISNTPAPAGVFNPALWELVCYVKSSEQVGVPTYEQLISQYSYYSPRAYITNWGDFDSLWIEDLETMSSDIWGDAKLEKQNFYGAGDIVLYDTELGDYTCAYLAILDMPADQELVLPGPPSSAYWRKLYCVRNDKGRSITDGPVKTCDLPNRTVVSLTADDKNLICVPVESYLE